LLHEAAHAWIILDLAERPVTLTIPRPDDDEDARCEWDVEGVPPAVVVMVSLAGLAAELLAEVPEELARRNAEEDLASLAALGLRGRVVDEALALTVDNLEEDTEAFRDFYCGLRDELLESGLPFRWQGGPDRIRRLRLVEMQIGAGDNLRISLTAISPPPSSSSPPSSPHPHNNTV